jgi:hypothetical protein
LIGLSVLSCHAAEFVISGTVINRVTGGAVVRARVRLDPVGRQVSSDSLGRFQFSNVAEGLYIVTAAKIGFDEDEGRLVEPTAPKSGMRIELTPLASLRGRITDEHGAPVEGVVVQALLESDVVRAGTTDDRGEYRIPLLPEGPYVVKAAGHEELKVIGETNPPRKTFRAFAPVSSNVLELVPGQDARVDLSIGLRKGYTISGKVTNLKPYTRPAIHLRRGDEDTAPTSSSVQIATGYFEVHDVLDGRYRLQVAGVGLHNEPLVGEVEIVVNGRDVEGVVIAARQKVSQ